jgi:hypothetical protein
MVVHMMSPTHVAVGGVLGLLAPGSDAVLAGALGGFLPDLDLLFGKHRRTLHFPWLYGVAASGFYGLSVVLNGFGSVAVFFAAAGVHSLMDRFAGAELRSWDSDRWRSKAVYDHLRGGWLPPGRVIQGGSVRDLVLCSSCGASLAVLGGGAISRVVLVLALLFGALYFAALRRVADAVPDEYTTLNGYVRDRLGLA